MNKALNYEQIYEYDIELIKSIQEKYKDDNELAWKVFRTFYQDPDGYPVGDTYREIGGVKCTADALMSIKRIFELENGFNANFREAFVKYRESPIFFFPCEQNGINQSRRYKSTFDDRIDYTLYDIKTYYDNKMNAKKCILKDAFMKAKTNKWLKNLGSFDSLIKEYDISEIFVDKTGNVYNIETGDVIEEVPEKIEYTEGYYNNLKSMIDKWKGRH